MTYSTDIAISIKNVSKDFHLPHEKHTSIKGTIVNLFKSKDKDVDTQHVLKNVSFNIYKGEFLGIVGRNGSGKSTLLKIISEIYRPTKGDVEVFGKLVPFIELGVGFNPELTGRENVYLNGALLGYSKHEVDERYDRIVQFAELEEFMDQKLKNYSSGMQVRLAFSVAIQADGDILVLDEVLAVGDEAFQRKCYSYFAQLKREKKTVVLVTHSMDSVQAFCDRAVLIDKDRDTETGTPITIAQIYRQLNDRDSVTVNAKKDGIKRAKGTRYVDMDIDHELTDGKHVFDITVSPRQAMDDPIVAFGIYRESGEQVYRWTSDEKAPAGFDLKEQSNIRIEIDNILPVGKFTTTLFIRKRDRSLDYAVFNDAVEFEVKGLAKRPNDTFWKVPETTAINGKKV